MSGTKATLEITEIKKDKNGNFVASVTIRAPSLGDLPVTVGVEAMCFEDVPKLVLGKLFEFAQEIQRSDSYNPPA